MTSVPAFDDESDIDPEHQDEGLPITANAFCELQIGHDIIVGGRPVRIYVKWGDNALPGETDLDHTGRVQEITLNTYLNHATQTRALLEKTAKESR